MDILVISLAGIGDTLFATPLIHELRLNFPDSRIDALVMYPGSRDVLEGNPFLNTIHQKNLIRVGTVEGLRYLAGLRRNKYDVSLNTHPQSRIHYRLAARVVGAAERISHKYHHASFFDRLLVNRSLPQDYQRHAVENNLALLQFLNVKPKLPRHEYELYLTAAENAWADDYLRSNQLAGRTLVGMHVGSGGTKNLALRRWPLKYYIELIQTLKRKRPDWKVLLFGGPEEEQAHKEIAEQLDTRTFLQPKSSDLRQAAALVAKCERFLSVDTVFMHIAAAMKVPRQFVIETPTWNKPIEPYRDSFVLIPNPAIAGKHLDYYRYDGGDIRGTAQEITKCMESVSVDAVAKAITSA